MLTSRGYAIHSPSSKLEPFTFERRESRNPSPVMSLR